MSQAFGGSGAYGRFPPINQGPSGMPIGPPVDPPGYYLGWPLANVAKRLAASLVDWVGFWVVAWFGVVVIGGTLSAVGGDSAGQVAIFPLLILIYVLGYYNVTLQQSRTGQSWGKRMSAAGEDERASPAIEDRPDVSAHHRGVRDAHRRGHLVDAALPLPPELW